MSSVLVVIDFQERLAPHIVGIDRIVKNSRKIVKTCRVLGIPILATEQIKLGKTINEIAELLNDKPILKSSFSCCGERTFVEALENMKANRCVLIGIETHICVLQTALDLLEMGYEVHVAFDCTGSRKEFDRDVAFRRMELAGVVPTTAETFIFENLKTAEAKEFKKILGIIKEG